MGCVSSSTGSNRRGVVKAGDGETAGKRKKKTAEVDRKQEDEEEEGCSGEDANNGNANNQPKEEKEKHLVYCKVMDEEREWDERCILTQQEIFKLWTSWNFVHDRVYKAGVHMFLLLFKQHPVLLAIFKRFGGVESGDGGLDGLLTKDNPDLKRHAATVMGLLDDAIVNLDKYELVRARLHCTARTHRQFSGFEARFFWLMREPFLGSLEAILAEKYTNAMRRIYEKTIDWILGELYTGFQEAPQ